MPAPVHNPAAQALPHMAHTPDPQPPQHTPAAAAVTAARPRIRDQIAENPLASLLGAVIVVLLGFNLTITHDRINRLENTVDARFAQVDARFAQVDARFAQVDARFAQVDARFAQVDARFASLESGVAEINLKLTALIAHLNATDAVDAALEGRLTGADTGERNRRTSLNAAGAARAASRRPRRATGPGPGPGSWRCPRSLKRSEASARSRPTPCGHTSAIRSRG